jgi:hypothetical protein
MKTKLTFLFLVAMLLASSLIHAQAPNSFNYQAVLRDGSGNLITSGMAQMRFTIRTGSASGTVQYQETASATVNQFGLVNHTVGTGTVVSGTMAGVSWASGNKYLQVEVNTGGGFVNLGAQQLVSVPFALYSANSGGGNWTKNGNNIHNANSGYVGIGTTSPSYPLDLRNTSNIEPLKIKGSAQEGRAILLEPGGAGSSYELFIKSTGLEFCENGAGCGRLFIANGGNVGIGTGSPSDKLSILNGDFSIQRNAPNNQRIGNIKLSNTNYTNAWAGLEVWQENGSDQTSLSLMTAYGTTTSKIFIQPEGNVGIGTTGPGYKLHVEGTAAKPGGGSWTVASDARLKDHVQPFNDGLATVMAIRPVKYHYNKKSGTDTSIEYVGVLAQELKEVAPYMTGTFKMNGEEYLDVDNSAMTYLLINAVKEQQQMIEVLKAEIELLKRKN